MYPSKANDQQTPEAPLPTTPPTTSTNILFNLEDDLSNISEDELIELLKPKFNKKEEIFHQPYHQADELIITTTPREIDELNRIEQQLEQQPSTTSPATTLSKTEKQRRKSMKLK
ncbi:unnamed protein product [Rotaria sp. Silwood1]|nr:unnamed protein product [Rotaria sp. Silwood1]